MQYVVYNCRQHARYVENPQGMGQGGFGRKRVGATVYCTGATVYCTVSIVHYTGATVYCTVYNVHCTGATVYCTVDIVQGTIYTVKMGQNHLPLASLVKCSSTVKS